MNTKPLSIFEANGTLIVAHDQKDARRIMRSQWGQVFPLTKPKTVDVTQDGGDTTETVTADEAVKFWNRGFAPSL